MKPADIRTPPRLHRFRHITLCFAVLIAAWRTAPCIAGQVGEVRIDSTDVISRAPGPEYHTGFLHRLLYGRRYGDLWVTPVRVDVLDLRGFAGGLKPLIRLEWGTERGLLFRAADGSDFVFRGLGLDSTRPASGSAAPDELSPFLPVPVTSAHPAGPLISSALLEAAEVLHAHPRLVALPDDSTLGTFQKEFGGRLGIFEEALDDDGERLGGEFLGATEITTTADLLARMVSDPAQRVDSRRYLAARLMDFLLGDFNWDPAGGRWARFGDGQASVWRPISLDMDHPFTRTGGILRAFNIASDIRLRAIQTGENRRSGGEPVGARLKSDDLDRNLLSGLDQMEWDSVTVALVARLSDAVIDSSVNAMPPEMRPPSAAGLSATLKHRRDRLTLFSRSYYRRLAEAVDLWTTEAPESVLIERLDARQVEVRLLEPGASGPAGAYVRYDRTLDDRYTSELRVYLRGGHDRVVVRGPGRAGIELRIVCSREGEDELADSSAAGGVHFYDEVGRSRITALHGRDVDRKPYEPQFPPTSPGHGAPAPNRDYGSSTTLSRWISAGRDNGFFIGGRFTHERFGFRQPVHASLTMVRASYSPDLRGYEIEASHEARRANSDLYGTLLVRASTADVTNFFGFGNETLDTLSESKDPYRVKVAHYEMEPTLILQSSPHVAVALGVPLRWTRSSEKASGDVIRALHPYGWGSYAQIGGRLGFLYGGTGPSFYGSRKPAAGLHLNAVGSYYPGTLGLATGFGSMEGSSSFGLGSAAPSLPVVMLRLSGKKLWGTYPFSDAAFLGGRSSLLGLPAQRFAGDAVLLEENELNVRLARFTLLTPGCFGVLGMVAAGRVFVSGESSSKWHSVVGTGLWFSPVGRGTRLSLDYVWSEVRSSFYFRGALGF